MDVHIFTLPLSLSLYLLRSFGVFGYINHNYLSNST